MEVLGRYKLKQQIDSMKEDPSKRNSLRHFLKYEIQSLVQRLAEVGEESVVVTANVVDGSHTVLASDHGEKFLHNKVVAHFMDHFITYLYKGRSTSPDTDADSANESCILRSEECSKSSNMHDEYYSTPPETFMHMKKHQIEQYNRRKDTDDKAIDDEVSKLVKNILKEGKEKEKLRSYSSVPFRRKRGCSSQSGSHTSECTSPKRLPITELFPTLSPMLSKKPIYKGFDSQSEHSESDKNNEEFIVIKSEPVDDGDYGGVTNITIENDSAIQGEVDEGNSNSCASDSVEKDSSEKNGISGAAANTSKGSQTCELSDASDGNNRNDSDDEIDLPFVEPFYKDREKCVEDVKLTALEIGSRTVIKRESESTAAPVTCYKQSRKKSNIFNLVLHGYSYIRDKQGNGGTIYWKCGRSGCKGRVIQRDQELIISQKHCHSPTQ